LEAEGEPARRAVEAEGVAALSAASALAEYDEAGSEDRRPFEIEA